MAKITLSEYAPKDQGDVRFRTADGEQFSVSPTSGLTTDDPAVIARAASHVLLNVEGDAEVEVAPTTEAFEPYDYPADEADEEIK